MKSHLKLDLKFGFSVGIWMNTCLCYYAFRFRPINLHLEMYPDLASKFLQICDLIFGSGLLLTAVTSFFMGLVMMTGLTHADISAGIAPLVGSIGLLMMSVYPIHLLLGGEDWISCIVEQYPAQREAFSGYVFVPTSFVVCAMFFGVTLLGRFVVPWNNDYTRPKLGLSSWDLIVNIKNSCFILEKF